tara:strand:- start:164 stop:778 length:615 start_codon:yes stop_codon:yes gene_type:complete
MEPTNAITPYTNKIVEQAMENVNACLPVLVEQNKDLTARNKNLEEKCEKLEKVISDQKVVIKQHEEEQMSQLQTGMLFINLDDDEIVRLCTIINKEKCIVPGDKVYIMKMNLVVHWRAVRDNWDTFITDNKTAKEAVAKKATEAAMAAMEAKAAKKNDPIEMQKREAKRQKTAETKELSAIMKEPDQDVKRARMASHLGIDLGA